MGGTTASAALIHRGELGPHPRIRVPRRHLDAGRFIKAGGYMLKVPTIDIAEVGAGAGSIAAHRRGRACCTSARSRPAPIPGRPATAWAAPSRPSPTPTSCSATCRRRLAGGALALDVDGGAARRSSATLGEPLGLSVEAAAQGIRAVANANMVRAIRAVTVERGLDPRDLTLLAFGGSGPVHACDLARDARHRRGCWSRRSPGVFTAVGMLAGDVEHHELRPLRGRLGRARRLRGRRRCASEMRAAATAALAAQGYAADAIDFADAIDLRLEGQDAALSIAASTPSTRAALAARVPRRLSRDLRLCADRRGRGGGAAAARRGAHRRRRSTSRR